MTKQFRIKVYGKKGCNKCSLLKGRLSKLLEEEKWQNFEMIDFDILTEDGLVAFVKEEVLNPQRIPCFVLQKRGNDGEYENILNPEYSKGTGSESLPFRFLGIETDYSSKGNGIIKPSDIDAVLEKVVGA